MPITLSPRPIAEIRSRISRADILAVLLLAILALVFGVGMHLIGNEMQTLEEICREIGPNGLPECVAVLDK